MALGRGLLMFERSRLIEWTRGEVVGPSRPLVDATVIEFHDRDFIDPTALRNGPLAWRPGPDGDSQEVLYFQRETPHRKYGAGILHPASQGLPTDTEPESAAQASDTLGIDPDSNELVEGAPSEDPSNDDSNREQSELADPSDDFEVTSPDTRHPSTMGISFCARLGAKGRVVVRLPMTRHFAWQD